MAHKNMNAITQAEDEIEKLIAKPVSIDEYAWNLAWAYTTRFTELVGRDDTECFFFFSNNLNKQGIFSDVFFPLQHVSGGYVRASADINYDIMHKYGVPVSLCHYHHAHGKMPSYQDGISLEHFVEDFAQHNSKVIIKEEDLASIDNTTFENGTLIYKGPLGIKYICLPLYEKEKGKRAFIDDIVARMREGRPFGAVQYGYSIIFARGQEYSAWLMVRCVYNDSQTPMPLSEAFLSKMRSAGTRVEPYSSNGSGAKFMTVDISRKIQLVKFTQRQMPNITDIDRVITTNVKNFKEVAR